MTIRFRGKSVDNSEWVYGDLLHIAGGCIIYHGSQDDYETTCSENVAVSLLNNEVSVIYPETVGQFTGILDKNGKEIFSGDLILIHGSSYQITVEVIFHKGMFCHKNKACGFTPIWFFSDRCEVIGNVYDNSNFNQI